jgi:hypothetical protein
MLAAIGAEVARRVALREAAREQRRGSSSDPPPATHSSNAARARLMQKADPLI